MRLTRQGLVEELATLRRHRDAIRLDLRAAEMRLAQAEAEKKRLLDLLVLAGRLVEEHEAQLAAIEAEAEAEA